MAVLADSLDCKRSDLAKQLLLRPMVLKVPGTYGIRQKTQFVPIMKSCVMPSFEKKCQAPE